MTIIARPNEVIPDSFLLLANLVVRKQKKSYRVIKSRTTGRKVLRPEELISFEENNQTTL